MKHKCDGLKRIIDGIKKQDPEYENIAPPVEMFSGRMYLSFTANKPYRGKMKRVDVPVLLSHCPFCFEKYESDDSSLCIRCGEKPAIIEGNYCKECDDAIDNGPVSKFFAEGGTKEEFEAISKSTDVKQMDVKIWPWKPGDLGFLCMPMKKNIPVPSQADWKLVECPSCGNSCWESDKHRELLKENPELKAACTECALRAEMGGVEDAQGR